MTTNTVTVTVTSRYNPDRKTAIRAKTHPGTNGRIYAVISRRQIKAAEGRVCYAGTDGLRFLPTAGYGDFSETYGRVCYAIKYTVAGN
jgi:hypothetical protein